MAESFEDRLWGYLMTEHGAQLATLPRRRRKTANPRSWVVGGSAVAAAGTAAGLAVALFATAATPAFAVTNNSNGTVTVRIHELVGISGANAELARLGVHARAVRLIPNCLKSLAQVPPAQWTYKAVRPEGATPSGQIRDNGGRTQIPVDPTRASSAVTIEPSQIPAGDTLVLAAREIASHVQLAVLMVRGPAPTCSSS